MRPHTLRQATATRSLPFGSHRNLHVVPNAVARQVASSREQIQRRSVLAAAQRKQLPIFPLNVVALPHAVVPLMIFEARYALAWLQMPFVCRGFGVASTHCGSVVAVHAIGSLTLSSSLADFVSSQSICSFMPTGRVCTAVLQPSSGRPACNSCISSAIWHCPVATLAPILIKQAT